MTVKEKSAVGAGTPATEKEINTTDIISQAIEKINIDGKNFKGNREKVIAEPTSNALQEFCRQSEEFARAVIDGGSIEDCVAEVVKGIKTQAVSDFEVYQSAVQYYFPGAIVDFQMTIRMSEYEEAAAPTADVNLSLNDLIDW